MRRRRYVALAASSGVIGVAGCSTSPGGDDTPTDGSGSPAQGTDQGVESLIATARTELTTAAQSLSLTDAPATFDEVAMAYDYDGETVTGALDAAESALEEAAPMAAADQEATVGFLRQYAAFLRTRTGFLDAVVAIVERIITASTAADEKRYEDAIVELEAARKAVPDARTRLTDLTDRLEALAADAPAETTLPIESFRTSRLTSAAVLTVMEEHARGGVDMAAGAREKAKADDLYNDGEYRRARDGYLTAESLYDAAKKRYLDASERVDIGPRSELTRRTCWSKTFIEALDHLVTACDHAIAGRFGKAGDSRKRARETINNADCAPI